MNLALAFGAAMTPVLFAYGGWQTASFLGGEVRDPRRTLPRGLILGVLGVIAVYVSVNFVYLRVLGAAGWRRRLLRPPPSCARCSGRAADN